MLHMSYNEKARETVFLSNFLSTVFFFYQTSCLSIELSPSPNRAFAVFLAFCLVFPAPRPHSNQLCFQPEQEESYSENSLKTKN